LDEFDSYEPPVKMLEKWSAPDELEIKLPPVPDFDLDLLPAALRPMVRDVAIRMQVPADFPAVVAVATLAGVCGRRVMIQPKALDDLWVVVPNLWGAIVAEAGMMKSPVIKAVTKPAKEVEKLWRLECEQSAQAYAHRRREWMLDQSLWDERYKKRQRTGKTGDSEGPPDIPDREPEAPIQRRLLTTDATLESLHKLLEQNKGGIFVLRDELTGWLTSLHKLGRESERSFYLECWNGDSSFTIDRVGRGSIYVENCCVSLFGGIQPSRLRYYFADAMREGQDSDGLVQRFQLLIWPDRPAKWVYKDDKPDADAFMKAELIYRRIAILDPAEPRLLRFSDSAQAFFGSWLTELMRDLDLPGDESHPALQSHFAKYRSLMPSLALLFSLADDENAKFVGEEHARQAARWCSYLKEHAKRVYESQVNPARIGALVLKKKLESGVSISPQTPGEFTFRELCRHEWRDLSEPGQARAALQVLEDNHWVRTEDYEDPFGNRPAGRPKNRYVINPEIVRRGELAMAVGRREEIKGSAQPQIAN
jgi:putative DNA primase/helicase